MADLAVAPAVVEGKQGNVQAVNSLGLAAIGGGGIGTLLVGFAQLIPESNTWRTVLVIIAPAISVGISSLWQWGVAGYTRKQQDKHAQETISRVRKYLEDRIKDPNTPEDMKENYKKKLGMLDDVVFNRDMDKINNPAS